MTRDHSKKIKVTIDQDLSDLIPGFLDNRRKDLVQIKAALGRGDLDEIRQIGHSMKGSGGGYGFEKISRIGGHIEQAALERDREGIEGAADDLAFYLAHIQVIYVPEEDNL